MWIRPGVNIKINTAYKDELGVFGEEIMELRGERIPVASAAMRSGIDINEVVDNYKNILKQRNSDARI